jgi:MoCo/4Fe-4S cofactor protein with predicted Tat translocation signal
MPSMTSKNTSQPAADEGTEQAQGFPLPVLSDKAPTLWRSLEEKRGDEALEASRADEFPADAGVLSAFDRRGFLQLLGGSAALAGAAACWRPPEENIYTHTHSPEYLPGVPQHYASALTFDALAAGVVVRSYDGRPVKVEGNSLHPVSAGSTSVFEQAAPYSLYDPDRARELSRRGGGQGWARFLLDVRNVLDGHAADGGARLRFLVQPTTSPTIADMRRQLRARFPNARFYGYSPISRENVRRGTQAAFGQALETRYALRRANVIVTLDSDFLFWEPERLRLSREFADRRVPEGPLNRLYAIEPTLTVTGMNADHRLRVKPSEVLAVGRALAAALAGTAPELGQLGAAGALSEKAQQFVRAVADDLASNRGRSVVIAGFRQPPAVHALCHAINVALGNLGQTVAVTRPMTDTVEDGVSQLRELAQEIEGGRVETLVIDAWNPVYAAAGDLDLGPLLQKVPNTLYHHAYVDETARACNWLVPQAHELESWGDARASDGTVSLIQPLVAPLFGGVPPVSFWGALIGKGEQSAYELVRSYWAGRTGQEGATFDAAWQRWLADGVMAGTAEAVVPAALTTGGVSAALQVSPAPTSGLELNIIPDYRVYDGRFGNNAWLQELPDPVTKVVWENTITVSPATALRLGVERHSLAQLTIDGRSVEGGVLVLPGHADDVVTVSLGYGRTAHAERLAGRHGFNAYLLRTVTAPWFRGGAEVARLPRKYELALTQDHWAMEGVGGQLRDIALLGDAHDTQGVEEAIFRNREVITRDMVMQEPVDYSKGHKWGMTIDLGRCIGCNSCVVACQSENNIPVVGKDQVIRAREMHWLMIDRYFIGADENEPEIITQPRMCVHCETAPCEYVCPVNATVHSDEGLNDMVYNRCVGTRYCSNNCPYKVRRFNYLHYSYGKSPTEKMMMNPEVTVRARGVMEKCTYCVQRIQQARISARTEHQKGLRPSPAIGSGDVKTACQTACPTQAIVFGDLNDPNAPVTRLHSDKRRYDLLYSLGTRPRTGYLARYKNYNPALPRPAHTQKESH